jgi:hypothetical protein
MPIILLPFLLSMLILNLNSRYNLLNLSSRCKLKKNKSNKTVYLAKKDKQMTMYIASDDYLHYCEVTTNKRT